MTIIQNVVSKNDGVKLPRHSAGPATNTAPTNIISKTAKPGKLFHFIT